MTIKLFFFLVGYGLMLIGFSTIMLYINLLGLGYNFKEYICYIVKLPEFIYLIIGFLFVNLSNFFKGDKNEKCV